VDSVKEILRLANPQKACYALEMMPWMYPTDLKDMLNLIAAVSLILQIGEMLNDRAYFWRS
jgi:hypothetical protein